MDAEDHGTQSIRRRSPHNPGLDMYGSGPRPNRTDQTFQEPMSGQGRRWNKVSGVTATVLHRLDAEHELLHRGVWTRIDDAPSDGNRVSTRTDGYGAVGPGRDPIDVKIDIIPHLQETGNDIENSLRGSSTTTFHQSRYARELEAYEFMTSQTPISSRVRRMAFDPQFF